MTRTPSEPRFVGHMLTWESHAEGQQHHFEVKGATFKRALRLRTKAADDQAKAGTSRGRVGRRFELLGRDALADGTATLIDNHNDWKLTFAIDDDAFLRLFEKYRAQVSL